MAKAKAASDKPKSTRARAPRKPKAEAGSRGLDAPSLADGSAPAEVTRLGEQIEADGGKVLATFKEPLGGHWSLLAALPADKIIPTPFQRDLSEAHVKRLTLVIDKLDRFLDPVILVRSPEGHYWTPNGNHRTAAMKALGAKAITCLVIPDIAVAYKILALNTEKAHNLREKAFEVIRMERDLAEREGSRKETEFLLEFEEPALLTLGLCYEQNGRFSGGAYRPILVRVDGFLDETLPKALAERARRAAKILELDEHVAVAVKALKEKGFESPYLKNFVVSRLNYLRFVKGDMPSFDEALDKMLNSAKKFDAGKIKTEDVARTAGAPEEAAEG
ncbi:MAG TPA: ParB N-terminal domain-containing protein [bacterium]|nr:ParB N-terminal domain-containing protein [bacterium]